MVTNVSRTTVTIDGQRACILCARRPQKRNAKGKWLSYCGPCAAELERERRAGRTWMLVTPEEAQAVRALRIKPAGRHHAAGLGRKVITMMTTRRIIATVVLAGGLMAGSVPAAVAAPSHHHHGHHHVFVCSEPFLTVNRWTGVVTGTGVTCPRG